MKPKIHPKYREVVFYDAQADYRLITRSTAQTQDTTTIDGVEYPLVKVDISSASHPFFTGKQTFVDTAGRVDKFQRKFGNKYSFQRSKKG
ncbi:MAG: type B 50S ribosomal protein L31 [Phycisphaerae bacterium]